MSVVTSPSKIAMSEEQGLPGMASMDLFSRLQTLNAPGHPATALSTATTAPSIAPPTIHVEMASGSNQDSEILQAQISGQLVDSSQDFTNTVEQDIKTTLSYPRAFTSEELAQMQGVNLPLYNLQSAESGSTSPDAQQAALVESHAEALGLDARFQFQPGQANATQHVMIEGAAYGNHYPQSSNEEMATFEGYTGPLTHATYPYGHLAYHHFHAAAAAAAAAEQQGNSMTHEHNISPVLPSPAPTRVPSPSAIYAQLHSAHYHNLARIQNHHLHHMHAHNCPQAYGFNQLHPHTAAHPFAHYQIAGHDMSGATPIEYKYAYPHLGLVMPGYHGTNFEVQSELGLPINSLSHVPTVEERPEEEDAAALDEQQQQHEQLRRQMQRIHQEERQQKIISDIDGSMIAASQPAQKRKMSVSKSDAPKKEKIKKQKMSVGSLVDAELADMQASESGANSDADMFKRRPQVKIACQHCKRACKKCDEQRPCGRCARLGLPDCNDAPRKERKKGFKRGPYKKQSGNKRNGSPNNSDGAEYGHDESYEVTHGKRKQTSRLQIQIGDSLVDTTAEEMLASGTPMLDSASAITPTDKLASPKFLDPNDGQLQLPMLKNTMPMPPMAIFHHPQQLSHLPCEPTPAVSPTAAR
ncbi:hypothetical protein HDV05_005942 [Chytridiales sp. JEL 0842]|nr:hypothetical protein HDV05_005942 [Chytridiales sp. JEL 0842]